MATHANDVLAELHECGERIDDWASNSLSRLGGSMPFFWFCVALDVMAAVGLVIGAMALLKVPLPSWAPVASVALLVVGYLSQTVIQLLMLPILQYSGNKAQQHGEARAEAEYRNVQSIEAAVIRIEAHLASNRALDMEAVKK